MTFETLLDAATDLESRFWAEENVNLSQLGAIAMRKASDLRLHLIEMQGGRALGGAELAKSTLYKTVLSTLLPLLSR